MTQPIPADPPCCEVFKSIAEELLGFEFTEQPGLFAMPYIERGENKWRVNFCPACGKDIRNIHYQFDV